MLVINGGFYEAGAPEATLLNRSFKYGDGLFETLRVYQGHILFSDAHFDRLFRGMQTLQFQFDAIPFKTQLLEQMTRLLQQEGIRHHGRIRLHIYRSGTGTYLPLDHTPFYLIEAYSLKDNFYDFRHPQSVSLVKYPHVPLAFGALSGFKTASALPYVSAALYAQSQGVDDVVLFHRKAMAETSSSNLFFIRRKTLFTPSLKTGCLEGIMRKQVFRLCRELHLPIKEGKYSAGRLNHADEIFVTNSIRGIIPVHRFEKRQLDVKEYKMVPFLRKCFFEYVESLV